MDNLTHKTAPLLFTMEQGVANFAPVWRAFIAQFTQPELLKLSSGYLGTRALHSSQIGSLRNGTMTEPCPKMFMAIGLVNVALAYCNGYPENLIERVPDLGYPKRLPAELEPFWAYRTPLLDAEGIAMGPTGIFEAFCGLRALPNVERPSLTGVDAEAASVAIGSYLRLQLPTLGIDWFEEIDTLAAECPSIRPLLMRKFVNGDRLVQDLETIARIAGTSIDTLWKIIDGALGKGSLGS